MNMIRTLGLGLAALGALSMGARDAKAITKTDPFEFAGEFGTNDYVWHFVRDPPTSTAGNGGITNAFGHNGSTHSGFVVEPRDADFYTIAMERASDFAAGQHCRASMWFFTQTGAVGGFAIQNSGGVDMGTVPFNTTFYPTSQYNMWTLLTTPVSPNTLRDDGNGVGKLVVTVWLINDLKNHVVWFDDMTLTCT